MARRVVVVGGGAAGIFAAITAAERGADVTVLEKSRQFLSKVKISGGGRCNVTHACFDPREFVTRYPRGSRELLGPFHRFQARDTVTWFESRGVKLKTEADGRMFPVTDDSQTIIDCLLQSAHAAGVKLQPGCAVTGIRPGFQLTTTSGELAADRVLLATGGCRGEQLAAGLGHTIEPPVPSLFTLEIEERWVRELAGLTVEAEVELVGTKLRERGPVLLTHAGLSGPAILRLSAWGAREFAAMNYRGVLRINWRADVSQLAKLRQEQGAKLVVNTPLLPVRLWERLVDDPEARWSKFSREAERRLVERLTRTELHFTGKTLNKDEFVTCGGVRLSEVDFKTMQSRVCPGLFLAGELLDIDGVTGGFNFQAAWTTGWIAGQNL